MITCYSLEYQILGCLEYYIHITHLQYLILMLMYTECSRIRGSQPTFFLLYR